MRTSDRKVNKSLENEIKRMLTQTFADISKAQNVDKFLKGFMTESEYETFAKRLAIAYWLKKGRSYANIKTNLKVSSATIASVQSMIDNPGFKEALKMIEADEWASQWSDKIKKFLPNV